MSRILIWKQRTIWIPYILDYTTDICCPVLRPPFENQTIWQPDMFGPFKYQISIVQWGSENWTCPVFEWFKVDQTWNGRPFENRTKTSIFKIKNKKSPVFEWIRISNVRFSDHDCIQMVTVFALNESLIWAPLFLKKDNSYPFVGGAFWIFDADLHVPSSSLFARELHSTKAALFQTSHNRTIWKIQQGSEERASE